MGLTREGFLKRLDSGKVVNCTYRTGELTGLISAWPSDGLFILTWEECRPGDQFDESAYTRDERHEFTTADAVLEFVERYGYPAAAFGP